MENNYVIEKRPTRLELEVDDLIKNDTSIDYVAFEDILKGDAVTSKGEKGDSTKPGHRGNIIGLAKENVLTGFPGKAVPGGKIEVSTWDFIKGDKIFLNGTMLSTTQPTSGDFSQCLGLMVGPKIMDIAIKNAVRL